MLKIIDSLTNRLDYADLIRENKEILKTVVEPNPRELKRFINNFMILYEWFSSSSPGIGKEERLLVKALQFRWDFFIKNLSLKEFRSSIIILTFYHVELYEIQNFVKEDTQEIGEITERVMKFIDKRRLELTDMYKSEEKSSVVPNEMKEESQLRRLKRNQERISQEISMYSLLDVEQVHSDLLHHITKLRDQYKEFVLEIRPQLWELLLQYSVTIYEIKNWDIYRRAGELTTEIMLDEIIDQKDKKVGPQPNPDSE